MSLPSELRAELEAAFGPLRVDRNVGGGCIGSAVRVEMGDLPFFLKYLPDSPPDFFAVEAVGLDALREGGSDLRIPRVAGFSDSSGGWSWILLEWLESGIGTDDCWRRLGLGLASLHGKVDGPWGWSRNGFIGRLPQSNAARQDWATFWSRNRLQPQLLALRDPELVGPAEDWARLFEALPDLLEAAAMEGPSLLHGDLWNGNVICGPAGPALIDPACYRGHREVDLAMADLFGGFGRGFFAEYEATWPLLPGYEVRRWVYQLYYLLVHVNLFGSSYVPRTTATLQSLLAVI